MKSSMASPDGLTLISRAAVSVHMPATKEVECLDDDCDLDMFENHYTYDVPDDHAVSDLTCPYCGGAELAEIEV